MKFVVCFSPLMPIIPITFEGLFRFFLIDSIYSNETKLDWSGLSLIHLKIYMYSCISGPRWSPLLKREISFIGHYCFLLFQNELKLSLHDNSLTYLLDFFCINICSADLYWMRKLYLF